MFTGIIESVAEVASVEATAEGGRLSLRGVPFAAHLAPGESVAVNGCCLTVTSTDPGRDGGVARFDLLAETLRVTNLGRLKPGALVNLERALRAGDRLSGHLVQGHVDLMADVRDFSPVGQDHRLEISLPASSGKYVIPRGSIAVDGISLTVAAIQEASIVCWIIPHTAAVTALRATRPGDFVNLEFDLIGKYVARHLAPTG